MKRDFSFFLQGLTVNPSAQASAVAFSLTQADPLHQLKNILGAISHLVGIHAPDRVPGAHRAALGALTAAGSGLYSLLEMYASDEGKDGYTAYSLCNSWVNQQLHDALTGLPLEMPTAFALAVKTNTLNVWRGDAARLGVEEQAGAWAGWMIAAQLLDALPYLEDGGAEDILSGLLKSLRRPLPVHAG